MILTVLLLAGCGGTKVYDIQKTIVYNDSMYNVTDTRSFTTSVGGTFQDGYEQDMKGIDSRSFKQLVEAHGPVRVEMAFTFDDEVVPYRDQTIDRWSEYRSMDRDFAKARDRIGDLMKSRKSRQVELR